MKKFQNILLLLGVVALVVLPLLVVEKSATDGEAAKGEEKEVEIFSGADGQVKEMVNQIQPDYKPWFEPPLKPPSSEIESMLFALQAALGAGFIGYWLGSSVTKAKERRIS